MKFSKKFLLALLLTSAATAAALAQTFNVIAGRQRGFVQQELQKVFGRDLSFDKLDVNLLPQPGFTASEIRLADDPRFAATPIVRAKELVLGVSLWNLLWGRIVIKSLIFKEPELQIITNEAGLLNLTALPERRKELRSFPRVPPTASGRRSGAVSFAIGEIRFRNGRVAYLDRSVQAPAELQLKNIELKIRGFSPKETTTVRLAGALTEGLSQDVRIEGELAPQADGESWGQRQMNLSIRFDSLYLPVIARAIASLRDRIPRALDVTGPMALQARASGTIDRPRIDDFTLMAPLFGASDYNAMASGAIDFTERRSWSAAQLRGAFNVTAVDLERVRQLPFLQQLLPAAIVTEGPISLFTRYEGRWDRLRMGAALVVDEADIRFRDWLRKPAAIPAAVRVKISRQTDKFLLQDAELRVGATRSHFSGSIETGSVPRLRLQLNGELTSLARWNPFATRSEFSTTAGRADWRLILDKALLSDEHWSVHGDLKVAGAELRHNGSGRRIEELNGQLLFMGRQARVDDVAFRVGSSRVSLRGVLPDLLEPRLEYELRSPQLNLNDLPVFSTASAIQLNNARGKGAWRFENGVSLLTGSFSAPQGSYQKLSFHDFRSDVLWSATGLAFDNLSLQIFDGTLRSKGRWTVAADNSRQLHVTWSADAIGAGRLLAQLIPPLKDRLVGSINARAQFNTGAGTGSVRDSLAGSGEISTDRGMIKDFNLARQLLLRGSGADGAAETAARLPPSVAGLLKQRDTPFESLKATFLLEQEKIRTDDLVLTTPDYTITGAGFLGLDRSTRWNGLLVLSPRLTQEMQRDYRMLRYLLNRSGRLAISFRLEGTIPNVKIRLDNRILTQILRGGTPSSEDEPEPRTEAPDKEGKNWLPDALERFLNR